MRSLITPADFANMIASAQYRRASGGESTIEAATNACRDHAISDVWRAPLIGFINDSPASAECWSRTRLDEALAAMAARVDAAAADYEETRQRCS